MALEKTKSPYISNKNHKKGCSKCENCESTDLKRTSTPEIQLIDWTCFICKAEHYWKYDNENDSFD
jgi:hypothetical protein